MTEQVIRTALSNLNSDRPVTGCGNLYTAVYAGLREHIHHRVLPFALYLE